MYGCTSISEMGNMMHVFSTASSMGYIDLWVVCLSSVMYVGNASWKPGMTEQIIPITFRRLFSFVICSLWIWICFTSYKLSLHRSDYQLPVYPWCLVNESETRFLGKTYWLMFERCASKPSKYAFRTSLLIFSPKKSPDQPPRFRTFSTFLWFCWATIQRLYSVDISFIKDPDF